MKPKWIEDLTVGAQIDDGRAGTKAVNIVGDVYQKHDGGIYRVDAGYSYGSISVGGVRITSLDRQYGSFAVTRNLTKRYYFTQIDSIERDAIRLIDHRFTSFNLLGVRVKGEKVAFDFGPGLAIVEQQKNAPLVDGAKLDVGGFYSLVYDLAPGWQLTHWATYRNSVTYAPDRVLDSAAALSGMITKTIGVRVSVAYNYEGVLAPSSLRVGIDTKNYLTTTVGVTLHH